MRLRDIGHALRDIGRTQGVETIGTNDNATSERRQQTQQGAKQGGLSGPVGPEQTQDLARSERERNITPDQVSAVTNRKIVRLQLHVLRSSPTFSGRARATTKRTARPGRR